MSTPTDTSASGSPGVDAERITAAMARARLVISDLRGLESYYLDSIEPAALAPAEDAAKDASALEEILTALTAAQAEIDRLMYFGLSYTFDRVAEAYHRETGAFAPGKDRPAAFGSVDDGRLLAQWQAWLTAKRAAVSPIVEAPNGK